MTTRLAAVDGIRGLACLLVVCTHALGVFMPASNPYIVGIGKNGVWLFFVLSAFLLTAQFERSGFAGRALLAYAVNRCLRIVPLFVIVVLMYWAWGTADINTWDDVKRAVLMQQGYVHLWTIPVEFKFYVLLPFVAVSFIYLKRKYGVVVMVALSAVLIGLLQLVWPYWLTPYNSLSTTWYLPCFIWGCAAAVALDKVQPWVTPWRATFVGTCILLVMALASPWPMHVLFDAPYDTWLRTQFVYLSLLWAIFVLFSADGRGLWGRGLSSLPLQKLGQWSYSLYLIHLLVLVKLAVLHPGSWTWMVLATFGAIAAGGVLHYVIELPIEKMRRALSLTLRNSRANLA
jgi:peptidoglycan/LPS O-acetylase OafA/YrhL